MSFILFIQIFLIWILQLRDILSFLCFCSAFISTERLDWENVLGRPSYTNINMYVVVFIFPSKWFQKQSRINKHRSSTVCPLILIFCRFRPVVDPAQCDQCKAVHPEPQSDRQSEETNSALQSHRALTHRKDCLFLQPVLLHIGEKNDWWNPWLPYVWLIGVNSHTLCQVSAAWTVISRALAGNMLTFPFDALSEVFWSDCCDCSGCIWHTTAWAKNFTLVLLALTVIYIYIYCMTMLILSTVLYLFTTFFLN